MIPVRVTLGRGYVRAVCARARFYVWTGVVGVAGNEDGDDDMGVDGDENEKKQRQGVAESSTAPAQTRSTQSGARRRARAGAWGVVRGPRRARCGGRRPNLLPLPPFLPFVPPAHPSPPPPAPDSACTRVRRSLVSALRTRGISIAPEADAEPEPAPERNRLVGLA
jgi:hypothetical protein